MLHTWLIPTFHGDIRLETKGEKRTLLHAYDLTSWEEKALASLRTRATSQRLMGDAWAKESDFLPLTNAAYRSKDGVTVELAAKIGDVEKILTKSLRPERQLVKVVKFSDGSVKDLDTYRTPTPPPPEAPPPPEPEVAATVARPVNGCPLPAFAEADIRASRVLETFLTDEQTYDYRRKGAFVTTGADTGRRYLVANREKPAVLRSQLGGRQLYDLDLGRPHCVHDWAVPPAEEMLALHLCLTLPGREMELLRLPEEHHIVEAWYRGAVH